jgi:hypothetical protein
MEKKKMLGLIFFVIAAVIVIINLAVIYPFINCSFAPLTFWLIAVVSIAGGFLTYFDVKIMHSEEPKA